jgi:hypothetical protein
MYHTKLLHVMVFNSELRDLAACFSKVQLWRYNKLNEAISHSFSLLKQLQRAIAKIIAGYFKHWF